MDHSLYLSGGVMVCAFVFILQSTLALGSVFEHAWIYAYGLCFFRAVFGIQIFFSESETHVLLFVAGECVLCATVLMHMFLYGEGLVRRSCLYPSIGTIAISQIALIVLKVGNVQDYFLDHDSYVRFHLSAIIGASIAMYACLGMCECSWSHLPKHRQTNRTVDFKNFFHPFLH